MKYLSILVSPVAKKDQYNCHDYNNDLYLCQGTEYPQQMRD